MRIPLVSLFITSPFAGLQEHAEKVKECAWAFQQAMECHMSEKCSTFENHHQNVVDLEREADAIKRRIRGHLPKGTLLPVDKFQLFRYLREQDSVVDAAKNVLSLVSYREETGIPQNLRKDFANLVDSVIEPIENLDNMVKESRKYFNSFSEKQRAIVKDIIRNLRQKEHEADQVEIMLKHKIFNINNDPVTVFHTFMLAEKIGEIADHAENTGDMMRAMVAR
ncbi:MAG: TIGR00153 family protein [Thermodesulfobacteriota bacterium]|nr:TIGR00153 family protein [Thermodesulfobacteriota bacterium]